MPKSRVWRVFCVTGCLLAVGLGGPGVVERVAAQGRPPARAAAERERQLRSPLALPSAAELAQARTAVLKPFKLWAAGRVDDFLALVPEQSTLKALWKRHPDRPGRAVRAWRQHIGAAASDAASVRLQPVRRCSRGQGLAVLGIAADPGVASAYQADPAALDGHLVVFTYQVKGETYLAITLKLGPRWRLLNQPFDVKRKDLPVGDGARWDGYAGLRRVSRVFTRASAPPAPGAGVVEA